jgi:hypothetical protein
MSLHCALWHCLLLTTVGATTPERMLLWHPDGKCPYPGPVNVSADSIGPLPINATIYELQRICPSADMDTTRRRFTDGMPAVPVVVFRFDSVEILAEFTAFKRLIEPGDHIDLWSVSGSARLFGTIPMNVPWSVLAKEGGNGTMTFSGPLTKVQFARWPTFVFVYRNLSTAGTGRHRVSEGHDYIPPSAVAEELLIRRNPT